MKLKKDKSIYFPASMFYHLPQKDRHFWRSTYVNNSGWILKIAPGDMVDKFIEILKSYDQKFIVIDEQTTEIALQLDPPAMTNYFNFLIRQEV